MNQNKFSDITDYNADTNEHLPSFHCCGVFSIYPLKINSTV